MQGDSDLGRLALEFHCNPHIENIVGIGQEQEQALQDVIAALRTAHDTLIHVLSCYHFFFRRTTHAMASDGVARSVAELALPRPGYEGVILALLQKSTQRLTINQIRERIYGLGLEISVPTIRRKLRLLCHEGLVNNNDACLPPGWAYTGTPAASSSAAPPSVHDHHAPSTDTTHKLPS